MKKIEDKMELYLTLREYSRTKQGDKFLALCEANKDVNRLTAYFISTLNDKEAATLEYDADTDQFVFTGHKRMNMNGMMKRTKKCPTSRLWASRR